MKKLVSIALFLIPAISFSQAKEFSWLVGKWKIKGKNSYEVWTVANDRKMLLGKSFDIKGADSVVSEKVQFRKEGDFFYYVVEAGSQSAVPFKIISFDDKKFVAENPQHDFPKIIRYQLQADGSLKAEIEGDGKVIPFFFKKIK